MQRGACRTAHETATRGADHGGRALESVGADMVNKRHTLLKWESWPAWPANRRLPCRHAPAMPFPSRIDDGLVDFGRRRLVRRLQRLSVFARHH